MKIIVVGLIYFCILNGCASGPYVPNSFSEKQSESYAFIKAESIGEKKLLAGFNHTILLQRIDDNYLGDSIKYRSGYPQEAYLEPGVHKIQIRYQRLHKYATACLKAHFEAGKEYLIKQSPGKKQVQFWLVDLIDNSKVGMRC